MKPSKKFREYVEPIKEKETIMFGLKKKKKRKRSNLRYPMDSYKSFYVYIIEAKYVDEDRLVDHVMNLSGYKVRVDIVNLIRATRDTL